ncbi:MAG TPA: dienelactone hydrolase family protein [Candidatus Polarisedimenticolaceae bacterium]|nr:dienelactone hydrolase family protein [Candidatus Polarisedimenticolaceae bacterium]
MGLRTRGTSSFVGALAVALLVSCRAPDGTVGPEDRSFVERPGEGPNVVEIATPWLDGCGSGCGNAYLELARRFAERGAPISAAELDRRLAAAEATADAPLLGLGRDELARRIVAELRIGWMLDDRERRGLAVAQLAERRGDGFVRRKLLFWDPLVGSFEGTLLLPGGSGRHPAILGLHGHRRDDETFVRDYFGEELAARGFAVLVPRLRADDCSRSENRIARELLERGFTLMGLRVYEALRMVDYLDTLPQVDAGRIALFGHSGGSSLANLLLRVSDRFDAAVVDHEVDFRKRRGPCHLHCETIPGMFPLAADINDRRTLAIPWMRASYKYVREGESGQVIDFLDRRLALVATTDP